MTKALKPPNGDHDQFWDGETKALFKKLLPNYQKFLLAFVKFGKGAPAYREAVNKDADQETAASCAWRMLRNTDIQKILGKLAEDNGEALYRVNRVYTEMTEATTIGRVPTGKDEDEEKAFRYGEVPDWGARKEGAAGLARLRGLNAPEKVEDDRVAALLELIHAKPAGAK